MRHNRGAPMPLVKPKLPIGNVLAEARHKLGMSQSQFGLALGSSHRTATRWDAGQAHPGAHEMRRLAELLLPLDVALAAEAAAHLGDTLESLGLAAPQPPPRPAPSPTPPQDLVDIVVCAAAEASDVSPRSMRPLLHVAFRRAREVGLTVQQVEQALAPPGSTEEKAGKTSPTSPSRRRG
jgi:transcriptional regulator with XRE-family HTH domain